MRAGWVAVLLLAALLGAAHLQSVAGWRIVLPSQPLWRNPPGDMAQAVAGAEAFLRDPAWHLPLAATDRLVADGRPLSIVYTDSAPWAAIAAKAAGLGAGSVSVIGLVLCLSFLLQPVAVALLLLAAGVRRFEVVALGTVLGTLLPAWYLRILYHVALSSHWVLVLALALAVRAIRTRVSPSIVAGLCALGALALGVHAYLFVMVAAVAAGGLLADAARIGRPALPRAAACLALFLATSAASARLLGYGAGGGGVSGFGRFSMNLLSPIAPQVSGVSLLATGDARPIIDATGGQYEGFNYLGAGVLLTLVLAAAWRVAGGGRSNRGVRRAAAPLAVAVAALAAAAPSNQVFLGHVRLLSFPLPGEASLDDIRATGRLFWPAAYALLVLTLSSLDKVPHRRMVAAALCLAALLQAVDTGPLRRLARATWTAAPLPPTAALEPWREGSLAGRGVRILPRFICTSLDDQSLLRELTLVVIRSGGRVEGGPVARTRPDACALDRFAALSTLDEPGWDRLLLWDVLTPAILRAAYQPDDCAPLPPGLACGDGVAAALHAGTLVPQPALLPSLTPLMPDETVGMTLAGAGRPLLGPGWWGPETDGTWTDGHRAALVLPLADGWRGGVAVAVDAFAYPPPSGADGQTVVVSVGGQVVARWTVSSRERGRFKADVPEGLVRAGRLVVLGFALPDAVAPRRADGTREPWLLGIKVRALSVRAITPSDAAAR